MRIIKITLSIFFIFIAGSIGSVFYIIQQPWIDFSVLENYDPGKPSVLLDEHNRVWGKFELHKREIIKYHEMPKHIVHAFLAAEDWNFFDHHGISIKGIIRSSLVNLYKRKIVQGASTITQQLVKLLFFDLSRNFKRKIKEQFLSLMVERQFTKEQILETYLNHVYLGAGIYGIEAACKNFWNKSAKEISIDQAAVLASIVRSPRSYCPLYNPENTLKRRNVILNSMNKLNFITDKEYNFYKDLNIEISDASRNKFENDNIAPHLKETIRIYLEDLIGKDKLYTAGLKIQTTLNIDLQQNAQKAFYKKIAAMREKNIENLDGALISIDKSSGAIKALIGGYSFNNSQFNRALYAKRQIGSTFKPIIYACAIMNGYSFNNIAIDEPLSLINGNSIWTPQNSTHRFEGPITLAHALANSNNIIAIKTLLNTGIYKIINLSKKCGLTGDFPPYPSLALGCVDCTLKEVAAMFNVFANNGIYTEPYFLNSVKDQWGNKIWKHTVKTKRVIEQKASGQVSKILSIAINRIRKILKIKKLDSESIGKTGTTNQFRTCWFAGSTPELTTALYLGCDDNKPMVGKGVYASRTALPIWFELNKTIKPTIKKFKYSPELKKIKINLKTGQSYDPNKPYDPNAYSILIDPNNINSKISTNALNFIF